MVAPLIAAAGIGAASSLLSGITGGKGAKKAAQIQAKSAADQIGAARENRDYQYGLNRGDIDRGDWAGSTTAALLGKGDPAEAKQAFDTFRGSDGYTFRLGEGAKAINTNAYARGQGDSGGTLKALERYGQDFGSGEFGKYLGYLGGLSGQGAGARSLVAGVGGNFVNQFSQATGNAADAASNAKLITSGNWADALRNAGNGVAYALGSSYKKAPPANYWATNPMGYA
jgi:hypothetical protein